jgi:hypothetical protein
MPSYNLSESQEPTKRWDAGKSRKGYEQTAKLTTFLLAPVQSAKPTLSRLPMPRSNQRF